MTLTYRSKDQDNHDGTNDDAIYAVSAALQLRKSHYKSTITKEIQNNIIKCHF